MHDQKATNLCHTYGTVSGLRRAMVQVVEKYSRREKSKQQTIGLSRHVVIKAGKTPVEVLDDRGTWNEETEMNICSFPSMFAVFIGCINPRSTEGIDGSVHYRVIQLF